MRSRHKKAALWWIVFSIICGVFVWRYFVHAAGEIVIDPSNGDIYQGCYQPFEFIMNTDGEITLAVDTKIIFGSDFSLNPYVASGYRTYLTGVMDNLYYPFITGSATAGSQNGEEYFYVNTTQSPGNATGGSDIRLITLYLSVANVTTGYLDIYNISSWDGDDSNISSGIDNDIQYVDLLSSVTTWEYTVTGYQYCPRRPYIVSGAYQQYTRVLTTTGAQRVWTSVIAGAHFIDEWVGDNIRNDRTYSTGWTIWTRDTWAIDNINTWVLLTITGNEGIQMISVQMFDEPNIEPVGDVTDGWTTTRQFWITGNIYTGYITFDNVLWNDGNTYQSGTDKYVDGFNIDVFWIDTTITTVYTSSIATGYGYEDVLLSGKVSTGYSSHTGRHADRSQKDDEFTITRFSGNTLLYGYSSTTAYNDDLVESYGGTAGTGFTMTKTFRFTQTWSGYVLYIDRAGNTWSVFINVKVEPYVEFSIYTIPAFRQNAGTLNNRSGLATTGDIRLAYKTWISENWIFNHNSAEGTGDQIGINYQGTWTVRMIPPGSGYEYLIVFKGSGMISVGFTWTRTNDIFDTNTNFFNFRTWQNNVGTHSAIFPEQYYLGTNYIIAGDFADDTAAKYDRINEFDLTEVNNSLTIWVFQWPNHYDVNLNSVIDAIEQAVVLRYDTLVGFIEYTTSMPKTKFIVWIGILTIGIGLSYYTNAATLSFSGADTLIKNCPSQIDIMIDTQQEEINSAGVNFFANDSYILNKVETNEGVFRSYANPKKLTARSKTFAGQEYRRILGTTSSRNGFKGNGIYASLIITPKSDTLILNFYAIPGSEWEDTNLVKVINGTTNDTLTEANSKTFTISKEECTVASLEELITTEPKPTVDTIEIEQVIEKTTETNIKNIFDRSQETNRLKKNRLYALIGLTVVILLILLVSSFKKKKNEEKNAKTK